MATQIPLSKVLPAIDRKDRNFYDNLSDDEKKSFSGFLLTRYASAISGDPELQYYYLVSTNHYANKYMFDLSRHKKLQWLMLTAASPNLGTFHHSWIPQKKKPKGTGSEIRKKLAILYPAMKNDELDLLSTMVTKKDLTQHAKDCGNNKS